MKGVRGLRFPKPGAGNAILAFLVTHPQRMQQQQLLRRQDI